MDYGNKHAHLPGKFVHSQACSRATALKAVLKTALTNDSRSLQKISQSEKAKLGRG